MGAPSESQRTRNKSPVPHPFAFVLAKGWDTATPNRTCPGVRFSRWEDPGAIPRTPTQKKQSTPQFMRLFGASETPARAPRLNLIRPLRFLSQGRIVALGQQDSGGTATEQVSRLPD